MRKVVWQFERSLVLLQVFGCIDGTHIGIKRSTENAQDFYKYKQIFPFTVQDFECRWPDSVHDAEVFSNSKINKKFPDKKDSKH